ncbi:MAG: helix-turn-helix domain-containing protein [Nostoc sp. EfeVER01]|uniref:helix-turn-helix domain-containing protein n=1 Tax=unclassified Nostoc TaxID=2593658 RepID=UPI002AD2AD7B|nr:MULTISPECIES: helix-turn-helix transcriptional regulator [unclassified Nostoc]MDZ7949009.1 helix-turn-helix transcriptional regulator [Nostoc sp. EfeVER01]MDZ7992520.1 helix-turn-helix transcriptional regulator [Nostoc sp. EspVER01]
MGSLYTRVGLEKLAEIVRSARGHDSVRAFAKKAGISHRTVTRIEETDLQEPEITTLQKIAPLTGYSKEELIAILEAKPHAPEIRQYRVAEDVIPLINQLPDTEAAKVAQHIIARLARPKVSLNGVQREGVSFHMELMNQKAMADVLRAIAEQIEQ